MKLRGTRHKKKSDIGKGKTSSRKSGGRAKIHKKKPSTSMVLPEIDELSEKQKKKGDNNEQED